MRPLVSEVDARILPSLQFWTRAHTHRNKFSDGLAAPYAFDESGRGNNLADSGGTGTLYASGVCNGYDAFRFNGGQDLRGAMVFTSLVKGAFAVVKHDGAGNWNANGGAGEGILTDFGGTAGALSGVGSASTVYTGGAHTAYVNGVQTATIADISQWNLLYVEFNALYTFSGTMMGRAGAGLGFLDGWIAECGYFGAVPSAVQRTAFFEALMTKYGITG